MEEIALSGIRKSSLLLDRLSLLKDKIEHRINLPEYRTDLKSLSLNFNLLQRMTLAAGLALQGKRTLEDLENITLEGSRIHETTFTKLNLQYLWSALIKYRYNDLDIDWSIAANRSRVINYEMLKGAEYLLDDDHLDSWLQVSTSENSAAMGQIPLLDLTIGTYEDDIAANLNLNARDIPNTQILIAGTTGSGKSNLLAVLMSEMRSVTVDSSYPVNFLFFDYKGEFSDPSNRSWLSYFEIDESAILDPIKTPLPFSPFKNFVGKTQNEINLYASELANALIAIDHVRMSANMGNRLTEAVIASYKVTKNKPITFQHILKEYVSLQDPKDRNKDDSVKSVLKQLTRNNLFAEEDSVDLIKNSFIVKMSDYPKDGPLAKAIVYFIISKLNTLYESLPKQNVSEECVEIRHFTIIDEAHYMLDFDNKPLRDLIAVGRNKGLSIILATQNMDSYKSRYFDFYANAQYPLIMKQQSISDTVIKDLFGVSGREFYSIKEAISGLALGELILKDSTSIALGLGKKYKKVKVSRLI